MNDELLGIATIATPLLLTLQIAINKRKEMTDNLPKCTFELERVYVNGNPYHMVKIICLGGKSEIIVKSFKIKNCQIAEVDYEESARGKYKQPSNWTNSIKGHFFVNSETFPRQAFSLKGNIDVPTIFEFWVKPLKTIDMMEISLSIIPILLSIRLKQPIKPALMITKEMQSDK